jgi:hypothetical protein
MNSPLSLTVAQLRQALAIKEQIGALENELASVLGAATPPSVPAATRSVPKRRTMSARVRAKMSVARTAWWAKKKAAAAELAARPKRKVSAAGKKRLSKLARARWAKIKAAGGRSLKPT